MRSACSLMLWLTVAACAPAGRAIVNEVVYDAPGDDTGWEFVELWNPGAAPVALAGVRLEAGDGSAAGRWTLRWTGGAADTVRPFARFVIGGARVQPPPDALVTLDLQNGPDAIRLVWPDGVIETVGWGVHEFAEYACGAPATDVAGGLALARVPDGADLGSNALDFRAADPTPGRANQPGRDLAIVRGSLVLSPERPAAGIAAVLNARAVNRGRVAIAPGEGVVHVTTDAGGEPRSVPLGEMAPDDTATIAADVVLPEGTWALVARVALAGDESAANDADTLRAGAGRAPLEVSEIQFHPSTGDGEWIELRGAGGTPFDLMGLVVVDRGGTRARIGEPYGIEPDARVVLAQDRAAWLARRATLDPRRVLSLSPWPSLNNSDDASGTADAIELRDAAGVLIERVAYSARGVPDGYPIERDQGVWRASGDIEGTPLAPPIVPSPVSGGFRIEPARIAIGGEVRATWDLPWWRASVTVSLWDLAGRRVGEVATEQVAPGRGSRAIALGGVRPGLYVAVLRARADDGAELRLSRALRVDGVEP